MQRYGCVIALCVIELKMGVPITARLFVIVPRRSPRRCAPGDDNVLRCSKSHVIPRPVRTLVVGISGLTHFSAGHTAGDRHVAALLAMTMVLDCTFWSQCGEDFGCILKEERIKNKE